MLCLLIPALAMGQALVTGRGSGAVTWTLIQHPNTSVVWSSGTTLAATTTSSATTTGNLLINLWTVNQSGNAIGPTLSSVSGDGSWTHCTACYGYAGISGGLTTVDGSYILSATGGATSIVTTVNTPMGTATAQLQPELIEVHRSTGTATFDVANNIAYTSGCNTNCAGPTLTITATDFCVTWGDFESTLTQPSTSYTNPADTLSTNANSGYAGALNMSVFSVPVWMQSSFDYASVGGMCFK